MEYVRRASFVFASSICHFSLGCLFFPLSVLPDEHGHENDPSLDSV